MFLARLANGIQYRVELFIWLFLDIIPFVLVVPVWVMIYQGDQTELIKTGFSLVSLISYYVASIWLLNMTDTHFEELWTENVRLGRIDTHIVKPAKLYLMPIMHMFAQKLLAITMFFIPFGMVLWFLRAYISFPNVTERLPIVAVFAGIGLMLNAAFSLMLVAGAFWFDQVEGLSHFKWALGSIFSGTLAPLSFFPIWVQKIAAFLPFQDIIQTPSLFLIGNLNAQAMILPFIRLSVYCVFIWALAIWFWNKSIRKYTSAGG